MSDERGRVQYVDIALGFATLVSFVVMAPWLYQAVSMGQGAIGPLGSIILALLLPMFVVSLIATIAVSGRSG